MSVSHSIPFDFCMKSSALAHRGLWNKILWGGFVLSYTHSLSLFPSLSLFYLIQSHLGLIKEWQMFLFLLNILLLFHTKTLFLSVFYKDKLHTVLIPQCCFSPPQSRQSIGSCPTSFILPSSLSLYTNLSSFLFPLSVSLYFSISLSLSLSYQLLNNNRLCIALRLKWILCHPNNMKGGFNFSKQLT
jgi:hypothetical protein